MHHIMFPPVCISCALSSSDPGALSPSLHWHTASPTPKGKNQLKHTEDDHLDGWPVLQARNALTLKLVMLPQLCSPGIQVLAVVHLSIALRDFLASENIP